MIIFTIEINTINHFLNNRAQILNYNNLVTKRVLNFFFFFFFFTKIVLNFIVV